MERIAVVELGRSQIKLTIADIECNGFVVLSSEIQPLKLWLENSSDCFLKKPQIEEIIGHIKNFKRVCEYYKVQKSYAYAYFLGVNKPKNLFSFFDEVFATSGFRFVVPTADEIMYSAYSCSINTLDAPKAFLLEI